MTFSEVLNKYIEQINCSSKDLSTTSQLSSAVISRYRKGERTPALKSKQFDQLVDGLYELSKNNNTELSKKEIASTLASSLNDIDINFEDLSKNINAIISALNINIADPVCPIFRAKGTTAACATSPNKFTSPSDFFCNSIPACAETVGVSTNVIILRSG